MQPVGALELDEVVVRRQIHDGGEQGGGLAESAKAP